MSSRRDHLSARGMIAALSLAATASACSPTLQDGRFSCSIDEDCPGGFACRTSDMLCYRTGTDGGVALDAPSAAPDTGVDDAALGDTGAGDAGDAGAPGCGTNCIQLMVVNADPSLTGSVTVDDRDGNAQLIAVPSYGTTSVPIDLPNMPVGGDLRVSFAPTNFREVPLPTEGRYLLVLGPAASGSSVLLLRSDPAPLHTGGYVEVRLIDMTADGTVELIARGAGKTPAATMVPNPFDHERISAELPFLPGTGALRLELGGASPMLIAALPADQIPDTEGTYYIVVAGHIEAHLSTNEGLRFIPGLPGAVALQSGRFVRFLNTIGASATVCDDGTPLFTLPSGELSLPSVPPTSDAWTVDVRAGTNCSTGVSHEVSVGTRVGRTLVSIAGNTAAWTAVSIPEPVPVGSNWTKVVHNALSTDSIIAGMTTPTLGTASIITTDAPTTITAMTSGSTVTFDWAPRSRQSWGVITIVAGTYLAYEVDSPFGAPWTVTTAPGR